MRSKSFIVLILLTLMVGNFFFALRYYSALKEIEGTKMVLATQRYNEKTINFLKMFIKRVIKSEKEVDFETRLKLENSVRELDDPQILDQWQKFVSSQTEAEAQKNVKELLDLLVDKVYIK